MRALVVGSEGQDGRLLCERLQHAGWEWWGLGRTASRGTSPLPTGTVDLADQAQVEALLEALEPDEIYYLAAHHQSAEIGTGRENVEAAYATNVAFLGNLLEALRRGPRRSRLFYASSSHVFAGTDSEPQSETTPFAPSTIYGASKAAGTALCQMYRGVHGVFASAGILYNHESAYRGPRFLSTRLIDGALAAAGGDDSPLMLGDLSAEADWGYAPEYVEAMRRVVALDEPADFIVATGRRMSVAAFAEAAYAAVGLDWRRYVREDRGVGIRSHRALVGSPDKLAHATGWRALTVLPELAGVILRERKALNDVLKST